MGSHGLAFKDWALKEAAYWTDETEDLRGRSLGIDAEEYLAGLLISITGNLFCQLLEGCLSP